MIELAVDRERFPAWYRVIVPRYAGAPLSGQGAARQGGRFNRPGQEALYLSLDEAAALAEYQQDNPWLQKSDRKRIISENDLAPAVRDGFPVTSYHTLFIPKRHTFDFFG